MSRARVTTSRIFETLGEAPDMIRVALKYPVLLAIFGFNGSMVIPLPIVGLAKYGSIVISLFLVAESPIIYRVVKEALRQMKQLAND